jgi:hypothetical protein
MAQKPQRLIKPPVLAPLGRTSISLEGQTPHHETPASLEGPSPSCEPPPRSRSPSARGAAPAPPTGALKALTTSRAPGSKANPRHAGCFWHCLGIRSRRYSTNPHNHPRRCASAVRNGRCHSITLCRPLTYLLHIAPLERGWRYPRKAYDHQLGAGPGQHRDTRMMEHVSSVTIGPVRPSPPLCCHPGYCRAIPNTV